MQKMGKKAQVGTMMILAIVIVGSIVVASGFGAFGSAWFFSTAQADDTQDTLKEDSCDGIAEVTYKYNDKDIELAGTDPGSDLRVLEPEQLRIADDGTADLVPLTEYRALAGNGSATYYKEELRFTTGCKDDRIDPELARVATITSSAFNADDGEPNSVSDRTPIGQAEEDLEVKIKYDANSNRYWGNPNIAGKPNVVTCQYDKSDIINIKVEDASSASKPSVFAFGTAGLGAGLYDGENSYNVASLKDGDENTITLLIDSVSGSDPGNGNFTCNFYDADLDVDEADLTLIQGVEDEDANPIFLAGFNVTVHYS
jgi:hypothetical protein